MLQACAEVGTAIVRCVSCLWASKASGGDRAMQVTMQRKSISQLEIWGLPGGGADCMPCGWKEEEGVADRGTACAQAWKHGGHCSSCPR